MGPKRFFVEKPPRRIKTNVGDQVFEKNGGACSLRHLSHFATLFQRDELSDEDEKLSLPAEHSFDRLHSLNVPVMIRTPHVNDRVETPAEFFMMISDIRNEIGERPIAPPDNAIFIVAVFARFYPDRPVLFIQESFLLKHFERPLSPPVLVNLFLL